MVDKALNSVDELNIDSFFRETPAKAAVADESEEDNPDTSESAPDENADESSQKRTDEDQEEDNDLEEDEEENEEDSEDEEEDEDDSEDEDLKRKKKKEDASKGIDALKKQADNAEKQRKQMQSERDAFKAQAEKADSKIDSLTERIEKLTELTEKLTKKAEQQDSSALFTGDDDALMTEGQIKKLLNKQAKEPEPERQLTEKEVKRLLDEQLKNQKESVDTEQPKIGSDEEALKAWEEASVEWVKNQPDTEEVGSYYNDHKATLDPELATIPTTTAGRYAAVRAKRMEAELKSTKKALRKAKQKLKRVEKGELPPTASGKRARPSVKENKSTGDPMIDFFEK